MMNSQVYDLVVIGGGPAGLAAAITAGRLSQAGVLLVDSSDRLGGHFYKQMPKGFKSTISSEDRKYIREFRLRNNLLLDSRVEVLSDNRVWGIFPSHDASLDDNGSGVRFGSGNFSIYLDSNTMVGPAIEARTLILAPGVYDRPFLFPGWTLPGVVTPGAVQMIMKRQGLVPGQRVLVAGSGPLQMAVAANLAKEGVEVVAYLDICSASESWWLMPLAMLGQWHRLSEAIRYYLILRKKGVKILFNHTVWKASGHPESGVEEATIAKVDKRGVPIPGSEVRLDVDTVCASYGFVPDIALTMQLGCAHRYDSRIGAYIPQHDASMETSLPGVFVAGDVTGIAGKPVADLQGEMAALAALERLESISSKDAGVRRGQLQKKIDRETRFSNMLWNRFRFRPAVLEVLPDETTICRCEDATIGDIRQSVDDGSRSLTGTKLRTRLGMGTCQGRYCLNNALIILAHASGSPVERLGTMSIRPPVVPVRVKDILAAFVQQEEQ